MAYQPDCLGNVVNDCPCIAIFCPWVDKCVQLARKNGPTWRVVITNWWKEADPEIWPDGLEPDGTVQRVLQGGILTEQIARNLAKEWNRRNDPGRLSAKAEVEQESD